MSTQPKHTYISRMFSKKKKIILNDAPHCVWPAKRWLSDTHCCRVKPIFHWISIWTSVSVNNPKQVSRKMLTQQWAATSADDYEGNINTSLIRSAPNLQEGMKPAGFFCRGWNHSSLFTSPSSWYIYIFFSDQKYSCRPRHVLTFPPRE